VDQVVVVTFVISFKDGTPVPLWLKHVPVTVGINTDTIRLLTFNHFGLMLASRRAPIMVDLRPNLSAKFL
jgi:hypothetical protein